ncbi:MAG: hypothetical protein V8T86_05850 [Victivallis sp.]
MRSLREIEIDDRQAEDRAVLDEIQETDLERLVIGEVHDSELKPADLDRHVDQ